MDLLRKCQELYDELRDISEDITELEKKIAVEGIETAEDNYAVEFDLAIRMSGCFEDLMYALDKLERERTGMEFYCNRVRKNAGSLMRVEIIDVG